MSICGLEGSGFILAVGLTLLLSGIIVYLMNTKIARLEKNIQNQNQVLTDVISDIKNHISVPSLTNEMMNFNGQDAGLASPEAIESAERYSQELHRDSCSAHCQKIVVSDDNLSNSDSDSSDSESESESESESGSESDTEVVSEKTDSLNDDKKVESVPEIINVMEINNQKTIHLSNSAASNDLSESERNEDSSDSESDSDSDNGIGIHAESHIKSLTIDNVEDLSKEIVEEITSVEKLDNTEPVDVDVELPTSVDPVTTSTENNEDSEVVHVDKVDSTEVDKKVTETTSININKLKVPELKRIVSSRGLASPNSIQSMKKKNLVELLRE